MSLAGLYQAEEVASRFGASNTVSKEPIFTAGGERLHGAFHAVIADF